MSLHVKKGDTVLVLTGKDKGAKGKIIHADPKSGKVRVENVNVASKHKKARSAQDTGGIIKMEGNIDASNVQIICPSCGKNTRISHMVTDNNKKVRQCKKCGASLDVKIEKTKKTKKADSKKKEDIKDSAKTDKKKPASKAGAKKKTAVKDPIEKDQNAVTEVSAAEEN